MPKTFEEFWALAFSTFPDSFVDQDHRTGELIVHTGLRMKPDGTIESMP